MNELKRLHITNLRKLSMKIIIRWYCLEPNCDTNTNSSDSRAANKSLLSPSQTQIKNYVIDDRDQYELRSFGGDHLAGAHLSFLLLCLFVEQRYGTFYIKSLIRWVWNFWNILSNKFLHCFMEIYLQSK